MFHNDLQPGLHRRPHGDVGGQAGRQAGGAGGGQGEDDPAGAARQLRRVRLDARRDDDVIDKAMEEVAAGFDLMFVHLPEVDLVGHAQGWMSARLPAPRWRAPTRRWGGCWRRCRPRRPSFVTADHGGVRLHPLVRAGRGRAHPLDREGPGIRAARALGSAHPHPGHRRHRRPRAGPAAWCPRLPGDRAGALDALASAAREGCGGGPARCSHNTRLGRATIAASRQATSPRMAMAPKPCRARLRAASSEP